MPIILDDTTKDHRYIVFSLKAIGTNPFVLPVDDSINFNISVTEAFSLQKPYKILGVNFSKIINILSITDGTNTVNFSDLIDEENDSIQILPDIQTSLAKQLFNKIRGIKLEPSDIVVNTRIRTAKLSSLGIGANPTLNYDIDYQIAFTFAMT